MAYASTTVPVERSQGEIRKLLVRFGAQRLAFGEERDDAGQRWAAVTFQAKLYAVRMRVPLKLVDERRQVAQLAEGGGLRRLNPALPELEPRE